MILITTTVCVDAQQPVSEQVVHLVQGDSGTRALRLVPIEGGEAIRMDNVAQAKVRAHPIKSGGSDLLIDCTLGELYADMVPTPALVANEEEWSCQLVLLDEDNQTITSMPFMVMVHPSVYTGDTVDHTNTTVVSMEWDEPTKILTMILRDGRRIISPPLNHTHGLASATAAGMISPAQYALLESLAGWCNQGVKTTDAPTFAGLTIGGLTIDSQGTIAGARFT